LIDNRSFFMGQIYQRNSVLSSGLEKRWAGFLLGVEYRRGEPDPAIEYNWQWDISFHAEDR
jgi:hypothetical protein